MNKILTTLVFICLCSLAFTQYDSKGEEYSQFKPGFMWKFTGFRPAIPEKVYKYDRLVFDLVYSDWIGDRDPFQNHWASIGLNTNLMFDIPLTKGNTVSLGIGLAHQYMKIRHDNHLIGDETAGTTNFVEKDTSDTFKRSILAGNAISLPLELRFHKESWRHFKIHLGGRVGYQANLFSKYVYGKFGDRDIFKSVGFPDQSALIYSAHIRFGLRNWALYGSYSFNPIFKSSNSVELNRIQFGLSLSLF